MRKELTQERLKELLHYDPETGVFTWREQVNGRVKAGSVAGHKHSDGRVRIMIDFGLYRAHRLAVLYMTGRFPDHQVDHIDRQPSNNAWNNLRVCSNSENGFNRSVKSGSKTGYKGVAFNGTSYSAAIKAQKVRYYLGSFPCPREAAHAYNVAAIRLHGEFAVLNPI